MGIKYTDEFLLNELQRFHNEYNKIPGIRDFRNNKNFPGDSVYLIHFGTWNNALKLAGLDVNRIQFKLTGNEECENCHTSSKSGWRYKNGKRLCQKCYNNTKYYNGVLNPNSSTGIGIITEHVVYEVLDDCTKCNTVDDFNAAYDLISIKYGNVNVKSSSSYKLVYENPYFWSFSKNKNAKIPDNYICIGFNKYKTEILKVWIVPGNSKIVKKNGIIISDSNSERSIKKFKQYEIDPTPYNEIYQNLDITTLSEFRNLNNINLINESINSLEIDTY